MVLGALPMTRAIGDQRLRPHVIPNPEVTIMARQAEDQLLVMATDGLWGVMSNSRVCEVAMAELVASEAEGVQGCAAMQRVSDKLMVAAVDSHTRDNVTIVVVDLRRPAAA
jgi:protein phosphatase 2C